MEYIILYMEKFLPFFVKVYKENPSITEGNFLLRLQQEHGEFILREICKPIRDMPSTAFLVAVMLACRQTIQDNRS